MAPIWDRSDGVTSLFASIISTAILYALSIGVLIVCARLLVLGVKRSLAITADAATKTWIFCSIWLALGHAVALFTFYDLHTPLAVTLMWAMIAVAGLTIGMAAAGGVLTLAVLICYKYL